MRITQLVAGNPFDRFFPGAVPSLLEETSKQTSADFDPNPIFISSFDDPALLESPVCYVNFGDRANWDLTASERAQLKAFLERGGLLVIDAGITAEFLRGETVYGQRHSFGNYEVHPDLDALFADLFPGKSFRQVPRSHEIFRSYYVGLPDPQYLPDTVRDFVVNEKWPQGTYSFMGLEIDERLAVIATPILALGWTRNELGQWVNPIGFRVRESAEGLDERLSEAAYSGVRYEVKREDGRHDVIYCQPETVPAWVQEPDGRWRVFRYYTTNEISDYAHTFYMRLGVNMMVYAVTE